MKAILIIDEMPECCLLCDFHRCTNLIVGYPNFCIAHDMDEINIDLDHERENWCPLRPLPQKLPKTKLYKGELFLNAEFVDGWNKCLDEIAKGE